MNKTKEEYASYEEARAFIRTVNIKSRREYFEKYKMKITKNNSFGDEYTFRNPEFSEQQRAEMKTSCEKYGEIFVK